MAVTLIATPKAANANAYASVADADAYFNTRLNADAWLTLTDADVKSRALITGATQLDAEVYVGQKTDAAQALKWPRKAKDSEYVLDEDGLTLDPDVVPRIIATANYELALTLINTLGTDPLSPDFLLKLDGLALPGGLNMDFRDVQTAASTDPFPPHVARLLRTVRKSLSSMRRISRT